MDHDPNGSHLGHLAAGLAGAAARAAGAAAGRCLRPPCIVASVAFALLVAASHCGRYLWPPHNAAATCGRLTLRPLLVAASNRGCYLWPPRTEAVLHCGRYFWPPSSEATFTTTAWPPCTATADRLATFGIQIATNLNDQNTL
jgi:hypothetical protein